LAGATDAALARATGAALAGGAAGSFRCFAASGAARCAKQDD
jgi:hypothetical protein